MSNLARKPQQWKGIVLFAAATMFALVLLIASVADSQINVVEGVAVALFLCAFFHVGFFLIRRARLQRADWGTNPSTFEKAMAGYDVGRAVFGIILIAAFGIFFSYGILSQAEGVELTTAFYAQLATYAVYFLVLRRIPMKLAPTAGKALRVGNDKGVPKFTRHDADVSLDLAIWDTRDGDRKFIVDFTFEELEKVECMTFLEAKQYVAYQSGLTFKEKLHATFGEIGGQYKYIQGKIARPKFFNRIQGPSLPILVLRGPDIFYILAVQNTLEETTQLCDAFNAYKQKRA